MWQHFSAGDPIWWSVASLVAYLVFWVAFIFATMAWVRMFSVKSTVKTTQTTDGESSGEVVPVAKKMRAKAQ